MKVNTKKIQSEIERLGWSLARLGVEIGMTRSAIAILLKRERAPLKTLDKIAEALNLDGKDLII